METSHLNNKQLRKDIVNYYLENLQTIKNRFEKASEESAFLQNGGNIMDYLKRNHEVITARNIVLQDYYSNLSRIELLYKKLLQEWYFLKNGGNILDFDIWLKSCKIEDFSNESYKDTSKNFLSTNSDDCQEDVSEKFPNVNQLETVGTVLHDDLPHEAAVEVFDVTDLENAKALDVEECCETFFLSSDFNINPLTSSVTIISVNESNCKVYNNVLYKNTDETGSVYAGISQSKLSKEIVTVSNYSENTHCTLPTIKLEPISNNGQHRQKHTGRKCCARNCPSGASDSSFTFPNIRGKNRQNMQMVSRLSHWVKNCGNPELLRKSPQALNGAYFVCWRHFQKSDVNAQKSRLSANAIPTIFNCCPISDSDMDIFMSDIITGIRKPSDYELAQNFENLMKKINWFCCDGCNEKHLSFDNKCVHKNSCRNFSAENDMDPGICPNELSDLTFIEEQLIAMVHPVISVFKLKGLQFGYSGNVINFSQDVHTFTKQLPHRIEDLPSVLNVKCKSKNSDVASLFQVRSEKIYKALVWLKQNNKFYADIQISQHNLNMLPKDGNILDQVHSVILEDMKHCSESVNHDSESQSNANNISSDYIEEDEENAFCDDDYHDEHDYISNDDIDVPNDDNDVENDDKQESEYLHFSGFPQVESQNLDEKIKANIFDWPEISSFPIDEFKTEGYIACAFPTLFPSGIADLRSPRPQKIDPADYFRHLLNYRDQRFAKHRTFRFFAMNSWMRWTAIKNGDILIQRNNKFANMNISELKSLLNKEPSTIKKIIFQNANIRGTKPYWNTRYNELVDMVDQLGLPTFFLTLSCADLHWPDLFRVITGQDNNLNLTEKERRQLLQDNPYIVDTFFHARVNCFVAEVLSKKYTIKDYWYRTEYQHRGSPHIHGIFWLENAVDVSNINNATEDELKQISQYFSNLISAFNPNPECSSDAVHPCRTLYCDICGNDHEKRNSDLAQILVKVQRHTKCSEDYCLRINKSTGKLECRFGFPFEHQSEAKIVVEEGKGPQFLPERNDNLLNKFNSFMIGVWRANMDICPVLSKEGLLQYLAKYIAKSEMKSRCLNDMINNVLQEFDEDQCIVKALKRLFIRTCAERDYSAQEVCHILSGKNLYTSGKRNFVNVNLSKDNDWIKIVRKKDSEVKSSKSVLEKYANRPSQFLHYSLWEVCKWYNLSKWSKNNVHNIVRVFPRLRLSQDEEQLEKYYRQLVLLHIPWRNENEFLSTGKSWNQIYSDKFGQTLTLDTSELQNAITCTDTENIENDEDEINDNHTNLEDFMILSRMMPNKIIEEVELGLRATDINYPWTQIQDKYKQFGSLNELKNFIKTQRELQAQDNEDSAFHLSHYSPEQEAVIQQVKKQIDFLKLNIMTVMDNIPLRTIVQGKAGTGKSLLIKFIKHAVSSEFGKEALMILGPTGVVAIQNGGKTIHSGLHIRPRENFFKELDAVIARKFCDQMGKVKFLVIDEYSMISCRLLRKIDLRCRQGTGISEPFGGLIVYFLGDVRQLPPVGEAALFATPFDHLGQQGKTTLKTFQKVFFLKTCFRQEDELFQNILDRISIGQSSLSDFKILSGRFMSNVTNRNEFKDNLHLFATRKEVNNYNCQKLRELNHSDMFHPVAKITGLHNCKAAQNGSLNDADGLSPVLYLAVGCKIMLKCNLALQFGLANGTRGTVIDILYDSDNEPPTGFPSVIICKFDSYNGPGIGPDNLVPIPPVTRSWISTDHKDCSRTQFPLVLCYACSIYKAQGMTLNKAVVDIGDREFQIGITYVGLSRVKSLNGLLLQSFDFERLYRFKNSPSMIQRKKFENFLKTLA